MDKRWNYLTAEVKPGLMGGHKPDVIQAELSKQGNLGWELVDIIAPGPLMPLLLVFKKEA